jgi:C-terminal processing protease CtpA/Prc
LKLLGDKYTRYIDADAYQALSKFDMVGAGVLLSPNQDGRMAVAAPPAPSSQASQLGIKKGDIITAINGMSTLEVLGQRL